VIVHRPRRLSTRPWVKHGIMALCIGVFLWELLAADPQSELGRYWLVPNQFLALATQGAILETDLYLPLFTAMFLHADILHLLLNMVFLEAFADDVEHYLGHVRFALFFLAVGGLTAATHIAAHPASELPVVGASGAIAGVMGFFLIQRPKAQISLAYIPVRTPAYLALGAWFALQLVNLRSAWHSSSPVDTAWWAHTGGFVYGMGFALWWRRRRGRKRRSAWWPRRMEQPARAAARTRTTAGTRARGRSRKRSAR